MIKALLLIFLPVPTWEHIAVAQRKWVSIFLTYFLPLLLLVSVAEGYGLAHWGKPRGKIPHRVILSVSQAVIYEIALAILTVVTVFILARLIKALGETFHGRHSFNQAFSVAAYGLSPLLFLRFFDMFPIISPWLTWTVGVVLAAATLYSGLPIVMKPDPPHAFGLYLMSMFMLVFVSGLARFLTAWYLQGRFTKLDALVSEITSRLSF
jgi:hypothetical protein